MEVKKVIMSQYLAALKMLEDGIAGCSDSLWDDAAYKNRFWQIAYHALFYTHLYLQDSLGLFVPWEKHKEGYENYGQDRSNRNAARLPQEPYSKDDILEFLQICQRQVKEKVSSVDLEAESGFHWLKINKLELQIYNIRHIQQHAGELAERLGTKENVDMLWWGWITD